MPELPDLALYVDAIACRVVGETVDKIELLNPFVLRTVEPPVSDFAGKEVLDVHRQDKRIVLECENDLYVAIHLMLAGRFRWLEPEKAPPKKLSLAAIRFQGGTLVLTEAGSKRRAAIHLLRGQQSLRELKRSGVEVLDAPLEEFRNAMTAKTRTLKRAMTDPDVLSGVGNAYSDEILHRAKLSPLRRTDQLDEEETARLHRATREVLIEWSARLKEEAGEDFPKKVTAFHPEMAVHGRFGEPCPVCDAPVQRIRYADRECNYCAGCQTDGRILADRVRSRLLGKDWPKTLAELEG